MATFDEPLFNDPLFDDPGDVVLIPFPGIPVCSVAIVAFPNCTIQLVS